MSRGHFIGLNRHRVMLRDRIRMETYRAAIEATVREGDVVLDLGTGTGILAMWAAQAGASKVYAIDPAPIVRLASKLADDNGLGDRIEFIEADSREVDLPEPVDVLVTEAMGNFFVTDEMMPVLRDAKRHCKPGARVIPSEIHMFLAPVFVPLNEDITFWDTPVGGLDLSGAHEFAMNATYVRYVQPDLLRGSTETFAELGLFDAPDTLEGTCRFAIGRTSEDETPDGDERKKSARTVINGFVGWFDAILTPDVTLSTAPGQRTHWGQMVFPIEPLTLEVGAEVELELKLAMSEAYTVRWTWSGRAVRDGETLASWSYDTDARFPDAA